MLNINTGTCPKCNKKVNHVNFENMPIHVNLRPFWKGVSFVCPSCKAILGVSYDHIALNEELKSDILKVLGVKRNRSQI